MVTNPDERQEMWREAVANYSQLADEVVVVNGGKELDANIPNFRQGCVLKFVMNEWPEQWRWQKLAEQLNSGLDACTGDWVLKLDIDQLIHKNDYARIKEAINNCRPEIEVLRLIKMNYVVNRRYYSKGAQPILFRRTPEVRFGFMPNFPMGDLCIPMRATGMGEDGIPIGEPITSDILDAHYWNFSYTFKTIEVAKAGFWRMARAYKDFYKSGALGDNEEESFQKLIDLTIDRLGKCQDTAEWHELPEEIVPALQALKEEQCGFNLWGQI